MTGPMTRPHRRRAHRGQRVALRPLRGADLETLGGWYDAELDRSDSDGSRLAITLRGSDRLIGVVVYHVELPEDGWLRFEEVTVEPELWGLGLDSEAVRMAEEEALARGLARRFRVLVRHDEGLRLYFWLRLGYRPAGSEGEATVMVRDTETSRCRPLS